MLFRSREPLQTVGRWLAENGDAVYGKKERRQGFLDGVFGGNGVFGASSDGRTVYLWNWIWPEGGTMAIGGYHTPPRSVRLLATGEPVGFEHAGNRIIVKDLPKTSPDKHAGIGVIAMEFDETPRYRFASAYPQLHGGSEYRG